MQGVPAWLHQLSIAYLLLGAVCAIALSVDVAGHRQKMWIMDIVWPVTALFGTVLVVWQYFTYGRQTIQRETPFPAAVGNGSLHCGAGCTLGDIVAEWLVFAVPAIAVAFGYGSVFGERIFAVWVFDFILAFAFGIFFQYFSIAPMRGLSLGPGIVAAVKADALSLTAWQIGMYGFMAFAAFYLFRTVLGVELRTDSVEFWFMMQIAMMFGFVTAYPVNWWLIRTGIKERM